MFKLFYEYDWAGCEREFRRAIALNPNYAFAHDQFGLATGLPGTARRGDRRGQARGSNWIRCRRKSRSTMSMALMFQGNYAAAKEQARKAAELDPTFFFPPMIYGWADLEAGSSATRSRR